MLFGILPYVSAFAIDVFAVRVLRYHVVDHWLLVVSPQNPTQLYPVLASQPTGDFLLTHLFFFFGELAPIGPTVSTPIWLRSTYRPFSVDPLFLFPIFV